MIVRQVMSLVIIAFCLTFIGIVIFHLKRKFTKYPAIRQNPAYPKPTISHDLEERSAPVRQTNVIRSFDNTPIVLSKGNLPGLKFDPNDELSVKRLPSLVSGNDGNPLNNAAPVIHQLASTGVVNGVVVSSLRGIYRATVDPSNLIQYADGTLSSIQKGVHGFGPHARFHSFIQPRYSA